MLSDLRILIRGFRVTALLLLLPLAVLAQRPRVQNLPRYDMKNYHFGFTLGVSRMDFRVIPTRDLVGLDSLFSIEPQYQYGFNIGIVANKRLWTEHLDLRFVPTLSFGDRTLEYMLKYQDTLRYLNKKHIESTLIDLPLTLKFKAKRINNSRAYVLGGIRYSIDLASQAEKKANSQDVVVKIKRHDFAGELGVGFDFYLNYFKFGTELKMAYGVRDLLQREPNVYTKGIDKLQSKIMWITFTFE
jgi:hypothetical protein